MTAVDYEDWLFCQISDPKLTPPEPWLEEIGRNYATARCVQRDGDPLELDKAGEEVGRPKGDEDWRRDSYFERAIGRIGGGPPPRGKPKPPPEAAAPISGEAAASIHRAMDFSRR